jgi:hypothetical protein
VSDDSLTILKYKLNGEFHFYVMDKFVAEDEPTRLDRMIEHSADLEMQHGEKYQELWIKTCPIFPTR